MNKLSPENLVDIILLNPTVHITRTDRNTGFKAKYELSPLMNLMFLRDQMITTRKGVVLGRMNSQQRSKEPKIIGFVLKKLGINPLYEVTGNGFLEGGDYLPAGDTAFIGQGLRTNEEAVQKLLENQVFGTEHVLVVKDTWRNQQEMHLDTYFNIISRDSVVLSEWRSSGQKGSATYPTSVDVYKLKNGAYQFEKTYEKFIDYLRKHFKNIILVSAEDQLSYGINFLTIAPNRILAIDGVSEKYKKDLEAIGVNTTWMNFSALTQAYGAAHCLTQVIKRDVDKSPVQTIEEDL